MEYGLYHNTPDTDTLRGYQAQAQTHYAWRPDLADADWTGWLESPRVFVSTANVLLDR